MKIKALIQYISFSLPSYIHMLYRILSEIGLIMAEGETGSANKEATFLSELIGNKPVTAVPGIEQVHANKLRGKGVRKVNFYFVITSCSVIQSSIYNACMVKCRHSVNLCSEKHGYCICHTVSSRQLHC